MKKIEFVRIDERLVHGQILTKWIKFTKCDEVVVLDDNMYDDPIMKSVMKMFFPKDIPFDILSIKEGVSEISQKLERNVRILLLIRNLNVLNDAFDAGICFDTVNISRLPFEPGKHLIADNIYVSNHDTEIIKRLLKKSVKFTVQMVPDSPVIDLGEIIKNEK